MTLLLSRGAGAARTVPPFDPAFAAWWQLPGEDLTASDAGSGRITLERDAGGIEATFYQEFRTIPGQAYSFTGSVLTSAMSIRFGTSVGSGSQVGANTSAGAFDIEFEAAGTSTFISLWPVNESTTSSIENMELTAD
jgi:hypothetical protein